MPAVSGSTNANISPELREDLEYIASDKGITFDQALDRYGWHHSLGEVVSDMMRSYPNDFAGARVTGPNATEISFSAAVPVSAQTKIDDYVNNNSAVRVTALFNLGYTQRQKIALVKAVHFEVSGRPEVKGNMTFYNPATREIDMTIQLEDGASPNALNTLGGVVLSKIDEQTGTGSGIGVRFYQTYEKISRPLAGSAVHQEGEILKLNGSSKCTTGSGTRSSTG